jgi:hypothetical protein
MGHAVAVNGSQTSLSIQCQRARRHRPGVADQLAVKYPGPRVNFELRVATAPEVTASAPRRCSPKGGEVRLASASACRVPAWAGTARQGPGTPFARN